MVPQKEGWGIGDRRRGAVGMLPTLAREATVVPCRRGNTWTLVSLNREGQTGIVDHFAIWIPCQPEVRIF
jgi:hypothetical protein